MWRFKRILCILLCIFTGVFSVPCAALTETPELTVLFTTDIHSNLVPHLALIDGVPARVGGYARLMSAVEANRQDERTLLFDSGDFSMGTLYQNFSVSDKLDLRLLDKLGYDAVALGNHDFEVGEDSLRKELGEFRSEGGGLTLLAGNLIYSDEKSISGEREGNPLGAQGVQNYTLIERAGLRIGVFSIMGDNAASYTPTEKFGFADPIKSAQCIVDKLRSEENADIVIMLSHAGHIPGDTNSEDSEIARRVKGIDVILSGHEHIVMKQSEKVGDTVIVCAGTALNYLGKMELRRENGVWDTSYSLIPLDGRWEEDKQIAALIGSYSARLDAGYLLSLGIMRDIMEDFAYSECDLYDGDSMGTSIADHPFARLLCDSYFYALEQEGIDDVEVAMIPVGTVRAGIYKEKLKIMDAYNVLSYGVSPFDGSSGAPIACVYLSGSELYDLCETSVSISPFISSAQFLFGGLRYSYCPSRPIFDRVYAVEVLSRESGGYEPVERSAERLYKVAVSWTSLQSLGLINDSAYGLIKLEPKNAGGSILESEDFVSCVARRKNGAELKEWYALYSFIDSMPENEDGLSVIDKSYSAPAGFLISSPASLSVFFKNPSRAAWIMLAAAILALFLLALIFVLLRRAFKKKHGRA